VGRKRQKTGLIDEKKVFPVRPAKTAVGTEKGGEREGKGKGSVAKKEKRKKGIRIDKKRLFRRPALKNNGSTD